MLTYWKHKGFVSIGGLLAFFPFAWAVEPTQDPAIQIQRESVRSIGQLTISQAEGVIHLRGWPQSKIEVHFSPQEEGAVGPRLEKVGDGFRLGSSNPEEIVRGTTVIRAPRQMALDILSQNSDIEVVNWSGNLLVRSNSGKINGRSLRSAQTQIICFDCQIGVEDMKGELMRVTGGKGPVNFDRVEAKDIYIETEEGDLSLRDTQASHVLVSNTGHISAERGSGSVYFRTAQGDVNLTQMNAYIRGNTGIGNITVNFAEMAGEQQAYFYSDSGNVTLGLPDDFSESIETVWNGKPVDSELPQWEPTPSKIVSWVSGLFRKWAKIDSVSSTQLEGKFFGYQPGRAPVIRVQTRKGQVRLLASGNY